MKPTLVIEFQILQTKEQTTNDERNGMKRNEMKWFMNRNKIII